MLMDPEATYRAVQRALTRVLPRFGFWSRYATTSLGRIHYYDSAPESAEPPATLLHGLGGCGLWMLPLAIPLARRRRVVLPDILCFGGLSQACRPALTTSEHVRAIADLLPAISAEPADVCGHSMGGGAALHLAAAYPEQVRSVAVINPGGFRDGFRQIHEEILALDARRAPGFYDRVFGSDSPYRRPPLRWIGPRLLARAFCQQGVRDYLSTIREHDFVDEVLHRITCRTLLLWGEQDGLLPTAIVQRLIADVPQLEVCSLANCAHAPVLEAPSAVLHRLTSFWRRSSSQNPRA